MASFMQHEILMARINTAFNMSYQLNKLYNLAPRVNSNAVVFSRLSAIAFPSMKSSAVGIKYVLEGEEKYFMGNKIHRITGQKFLVVNPMQEFSASIDSNTIAVGLCIDINTRMFVDVHHALTNNVATLLDNGPDHPQVFPGIGDQAFNVGSNSLGKKLNELTLDICKGQDPLFDEEFFYTLAREMVLLDDTVKAKISAIPSKKTGTQQELYRRVARVKELLDDLPAENISIDRLAREASLSRYHLIRTFKQVYYYSPYQYHLKRRLSYAAQLIKDGKFSLEEIAMKTGFPDVHSFSKAFRKAYKCPPGKFRSYLNKDLK